MDGFRYEAGKCVDRMKQRERGAENQIILKLCTECVKTNRFHKENFITLSLRAEEALLKTITHTSMTIRL